MSKFFVDRIQKVNEEEINIIGEDFNHIKNVLRAKRKDKINICVKEEKITYICQIDEFVNEYVKCKILDRENESNEPNTYIGVFQGLPKSDKMEFIIQKATELGVGEITPLVTSRSIIKVDSKGEQDRLKRWNKIILAAAKQSGRDIIPKINNFVNLQNVYEFLEEYDIVLVAYENERQNTLKSELKKIKQKNAKIAVVIGPEGGFSEKEINDLVSFGAKGITLGSRILRTETVALTVISNIIYELE